MIVACHELVNALHPHANVRRLTVASQDVLPIQATDWWIMSERGVRSMVVVEMQVG